VRHDEDAQQAALFAWIRAREGEVEALRFCFHPPNGGMRSKATAANMQRLGVRRGCPDVWLPMPTPGYTGPGSPGHIGLVIEMKAGRNKPTPEQHAWLDFLARQGWQVAVCYDWLDAARLICSHLRLPADLWPPEEIT
jgi:hypothetical protein